jgi:cytochrome P450
MPNAEQMVDRPAHVPPEAVFDFDIFHDAGLLKDPHGRALELLREAPAVFWTPRNSGHWMAIRYQDAHLILRNPNTYSSSLLAPEQKTAMANSALPGTPRFPDLKPIMYDPPDHTKFRLPLQKLFAPKTIHALQAELDSLAHQLIDAVVDEGACDFIAAVAEPFPVRIFLQMMGLPVGRLAEFRALVREAFDPAGYDPRVYGMRLRRIADAMMDVILARRQHPTDDLISRLWTIDIDGEPMSKEFIEDYAALLFLAGLDTVINAISFGMRHLAVNPELQASLRADPSLIPEAVEEVLRRYTFTIPVRRLTQDTALCGRLLKTGDRILCYLPAADLDADEFPAPEVFDVGRENKRHMAFGVGPHRCLGSHLARLELQTLFAVVLKRLPTFRLEPGHRIKFHTGQMLAVDSLRLRWD